MGVFLEDSAALVNFVACHGMILRVLLVVRVMSIEARWKSHDIFRELRSPRSPKPRGSDRAMSDCTIVVPCYNEARRLDLQAFLAHVLRHHDTFLFVNDGSTDQTGRLLDELCDVSPASFRVLHLPQNRGKAEAVRQGILSALASPGAIRGLLGRRPGHAAGGDWRISHLFRSASARRSVAGARRAAAREANRAAFIAALPGPALCDGRSRRAQDSRL